MDALHRQEDEHVLIGRRAHLDPLAEAAALRPRAAAVGAELSPVEQDGGHRLGRLDLAAPDAAREGRGREPVARRPRPGAAVEHQLQREERIAPVMGLGRVPQRQVVHAGRALGRDAGRQGLRQAAIDEVGHHLADGVAHGDGGGGLCVQDAARAAR
jgi:hypothetical protein